MDFKFLHELIAPAQTKIVMLVLDGLGGLPLESGGRERTGASGFVRV